MALVMVLLVVAGIVLIAVVAALSVVAAWNAQNRRLPPTPPPAGEWLGYQGPGGPIYPAYNPALYLSPADRERIIVLVRGGQKIQAIKLYRGTTGASLAEAKAAIDHLERFR